MERDVGCLWYLVPFVYCSEKNLMNFFFNEEENLLIESLPTPTLFLSLLHKEKYVCMDKPGGA